MGKTCLARAYAERHLDDYTLVWWIRAENLAAATGDFRTLLELLDPDRAGKVSAPITAAYSLLAARPGTWLILLDSLPGPTALPALLPASGTGHVLVTSRASVWNDRTPRIEVPPLAETAVVQLLMSLSEDSDDVAATALAAEMGGLPLALAQAACYARITGCGLAEYLEQFRTRRQELLAEDQIPDFRAPDYHQTVAAAWQLALQSLNSPARTLLNILSYYAPDAIPVSLLLTPHASRALQFPLDVESLVRPLLENTSVRHRAIAELINYGLVARPVTLTG